MYITGIAPSPRKLREKNLFPSSEMVYLAKKALKRYRASHLITSLSFGWEQAMTKAAIELGVPFTVAIPYPGQDTTWRSNARSYYLDLISKADEVYRVSDYYSEGALLEGHLWRADRSDIVFALWEYEFEGETFDVLDYALAKGKRVVNLWEDWEHLVKMRERPDSAKRKSSRSGAQIFSRERDS